MLLNLFDLLGKTIQSLLNSSLINGNVPVCFKPAVVQLLLKKPNLDCTVLSNYRPISKLPFLSKILEKVVLSQLASYLDMNAVIDMFQSGIRSLHSTESALLKVFNYIFLAVDSGKVVILILLDLTAAFDTVDQGILLQRLEDVGVKGTALEWFESYLKNRSFSVCLGDLCPTSAKLHSGVPQGSILGPILFSLYMGPLSSIFRKYNIKYHLYADDTQLYIPIDPNGSQSFAQCLGEIRAWLASNFLHLNTNKTECVVFGPSSASKEIISRLASMKISVSDHVKNLGVTMDSALVLDKQVSSVVKAAFYQLRIISKLKSILSFKDLETIIHAFVSSRIDYCNSVYIGISQSVISSSISTKCCCQTFDSYKEERENYSSLGFFTLVACRI